MDVFVRACMVYMCAFVVVLVASEPQSASAVRRSQKMRMWEMLPGRGQRVPLPANTTSQHSIRGEMEPVRSRGERVRHRPRGC